jgi:hypothetical protein
MIVDGKHGLHSLPDAKSGKKLCELPQEKSIARPLERQSNAL